jgi:hypothetical protein
MTIISFLLFTALASGLTWFFTRKDEAQSSDGFFLGGRSLTFPIIAGSLLLTNLSTTTCSHHPHPNRGIHRLTQAGRLCASPKVQKVSTFGIRHASIWISFR